MSIEITHDSKTGVFRLSYKRHIYIALGMLLVASGLATFTGPWWQGVLEGLLGQVNVVIESKYQSVIGFGQVASGIALLAYKLFWLDRKQAKLDADKLMLKQVDIGIEKVRSYLDGLVDDHSYKSSPHRHFTEVCTRFIRPEFSFQDRVTAVLYKNFSTSANDLELFVGRNFFVFPNGRSVDGDFRYCLAPHLNMDRGMTSYDSTNVAEYDALKMELHRLVESASEAFKVLVTRLKEVGHV